MLALERLGPAGARRQIEGEHRTASHLGVDMEPASAFLEQAPHDAQSQSRAMSRLSPPSISDVKPVWRP
jgi:hypothetical protein